MSDEYDIFDEAEVEDRLLRKSREDGRRKLGEAIQREIGFRAALRSETRQRDERWWHGLDWRRRGSRIG